MRSSIVWLAAVASCMGVTVTPDAMPEPAFASERGFVDLEGRHLFYVLFSADSDPSRKPLFVVFNGGPGFPTTLGLLVDGTAPMRIVDGAGIVVNPASFTALGSVLYIDQRLAGFSYDDAPANLQFDMRGDAIEFARTIVRVLDGHPILQKAPVVLVGESYGGTRAQLVLDDLLHYASVSEIRDDVQRHLEAVYPPADVHAPEQIAEQFFAQVLIQPYVMGSLQFQLSDPPSGTCMYDTRLDSAHCFDPDVAARAIATPDGGATLLGGRLEDIVDLTGPTRHGGRGGVCWEGVEDDLVARLGPLDEGDCYLGLGPFDSEWLSDTTLVPAAFTRNLALVKTLITNARYDGVVDSTAIARALGTEIDPASPVGAERPGEILVTLDDGQRATIRVPTYEAGHMVTRTQAAELRADIASWLGL